LHLDSGTCLLTAALHCHHHTARPHHTPPLGAHFPPPEVPPSGMETSPIPLGFSYSLPPTIQFSPHHYTFLPTYSSTTSSSFLHTARILLFLTFLPHCTQVHYSAPSSLHLPHCSYPCTSHSYLHLTLTAFSLPPPPLGPPAPAHTTSLIPSVVRFLHHLGFHPALHTFAHCLFYRFLCTCLVSHLHCFLSYTPLCLCLHHTSLHLLHGSWVLRFLGFTPPWVFTTTPPPHTPHHTTIVPTSHRVPHTASPTSTPPPDFLDLQGPTSHRVLPPTPPGPPHTHTATHTPALHTATALLHRCGATTPRSRAWVFTTDFYHHTFVHHSLGAQFLPLGPLTAHPPTLPIHTFPTGGVPYHPTPPQPGGRPWALPSPPDTLFPQWDRPTGLGLWVHSAAACSCASRTNASAIALFSLSVLPLLSAALSSLHTSSHLTSPTSPILAPASNYALSGFFWDLLLPPHCSFLCCLHLLHLLLHTTFFHSPACTGCLGLPATCTAPTCHCTAWVLPGVGLEVPYSHLWRWWDFGVGGIWESYRVHLGPPPG